MNTPTDFLPPPAPEKTPLPDALRIVVIYVVLASLWILFSEPAFALPFNGTPLRLRADAHKDWVSVTASTLLLYLLLRQVLLNYASNAIKFTEAGMNDFISKLFHTDALYRSVLSWLGAKAEQ